MKRRQLGLCGLFGLMGMLWGVAAEAQFASNQGRPPQVAAATTGPTLENCLVQLMDEADVPAQEVGVLSQINVRAGDSVRAGQLLVQVDDRRAQLEKELAVYQYNSALEKSTNDINVRFAKAAADLARSECLANADANRRVPNSVALSEVRKAELEYKKAVLQIEQSQLDQSVAAHDAKAAASKVESADHTMRRCRVTSPIDGVVVDVRRHLGEWVQAGDVMLHVERLDRLKVEGFVKASEYRGARIQGRNVRIEMDLPGGEKRQLTGKITFVHLNIQTAGDYQVWAEINNRQENGQWLLQPGLTVTMRID